MWASLNKGETTPYLIKTFLMYGLIALSIIITKVLIARLYGQEQLGIFSFFFGLVSVLFLFTSFGFPEAVTQIIVKDHTVARAALKEAIKWASLFTIIFSLPFLLSDFFLASTSLKLNFIVYILTYTFFYFGYSILRGYKRFVAGSWYSLVNRLLFIFFVIGAYYASLVEFSSVLYGLSLALFVAGLFFIRPCLKLIQISSESKSINTTEFRHLAFSLFLMQAGFYLLREIDLIVIPYLVDFTQLGLYSAHSSLSNIIRLIAYVFPVVVLPLAVVSRYKLQQSFRRIVTILVPFTALVLAATYILVPLLYGEEYVNVLLPIALVISSSLMVIYSYFNSVFVGENQVSKSYITIISVDFGLSLLVNTGLTILFVWWWGIIGAPIATAATVLLKIALNLYGIQRLRKEKEIDGAGEITTPDSSSKSL